MLRHRGTLRPFAILGLPLALVLLSAVPAARAVSHHSTSIDLTPDGNEVWVVNPDHGTVGVIKTRESRANQLLAEIPVGRAPWCVDIHPTNGEVWVTSYRDDEITIIDGPSRTVIDHIPTGYETFGVAFDPTGARALVTASGADRVYEIDVATRTITRTTDVERRPRGIAWSTDGTRAWITHLLTPGYFGTLTELDVVAGTATVIDLRQTFGTNRGGYPSCLQTATLAPAPGDSILWLPNETINAAKGAISGVPLTPTNLFHAVIRPVNVLTREDLNWDTYFLSEGGTPASGYAGGTTPVGGPIAVDFRLGHAYVANLHSDDVTILDADLLDPVEIGTFAAGRAPIGIVTHPDIHRVWVANWLSRDVTVYNPSSMVPVATVPSTTTEPLDPCVLNGKRLFYTSTGRMSFENRNSCSGCHVFGRPDARTWDLSQFGGRLVRATKDWRDCGWTPPYGWTASFDEIHDNEWSIRGLMGGEGLTEAPNPSLGEPNAGLSHDLDDLSLFIALDRHRPDTPYLRPDGSLTPSAEAGQAIFLDEAVGCASCHLPPFYTDSSMQANPFILHDVGTSVDSTTAGGLDTPSLVGTWDQGPWLHHHQAKTLEAVLTTFNPDDRHGVTSHLTSEQVTQLADFLRSIASPPDVGSPVDAPVVERPPSRDAARAVPNPFSERTSLRFEVTRGAALVRIDLVDARGRRVRSLLERRLPAGTHTVGWDGTDDRGRRVAAGVYFARLTLDGERMRTRKMTLLR